MDNTNYENNRTDKIKKLLEKFSLNPEHIPAIQDPIINPSYNAPYHNSQHLITVSLAAVRLGQYYSSDPYNPEIKILLLAGLYSDINHSQGRFGDSVNVARSVNDMVNILEQLEPELNDQQLTRIGNLILATEHPHKPPKTMEEKIIQDSDLLQWVEPDQTVWLDGLSKETGSPVNVETVKKFISFTQVNTYQAGVELRKQGLTEHGW